MKGMRMRKTGKENINIRFVRRRFLILTAAAVAASVSMGALALFGNGILSEKLGDISSVVLMSGVIPMTGLVIHQELYGFGKNKSRDMDIILSVITIASVAGVPVIMNFSPKVEHITDKKNAVIAASAVFFILLFLYIARETERKIRERRNAEYDNKQ